MNTVDGLLPNIIQHVKLSTSLIPTKDKRILVSLSNQINTGVFLTENQANLLIKILTENLTSITPLIQDVEKIINDRLWSKEFRVIEKFRKIYVNEEDHDKFTVDFSFNSRLREKLSKLSSTTAIQSNVIIKGSKHTYILTEVNVFNVIDALKHDHFTIDESLLAIYKEIVKIKKTTVSPLDIFSTSNEKLRKLVTEKVGDISEENIRLLHDRKIRYQYQVSQPLSDLSLTARIATRSSRKIYVNPAEISFPEVMQSLIELQRLPLLIIFEGQQSAKDKQVLHLIESVVSDLNLSKNIGVYFRYDTPSDTENFNQEISKLCYNKSLDDSTSIAGITNTKLPKFMIKQNWKPQAIISFTNSFRSNKASVYFNDVDLVVYFTNTKPLDESIHALM